LSKDDLILARDVEARYALRDRRLRYTVLAPLGTWLALGALRVLRVRDASGPDGADLVELVLGYDAYEAA
jgi:hypothetical protein